MAIPSFVKTGFTIVYDATGEGGTITFKVLSVSGTSVAEQVTETEDGNAFESSTFDVTVTPGSDSNVGAQFWVDPNNPTGSIVGPDGETYTKLGTETVDGASVTVLGFTENINTIFGTVTTATGNVEYLTSSGLIIQEGIQYYPQLTDYDSATLDFAGILAGTPPSSTPSSPVSLPPTAINDFSGTGVSSLLWQNSNGTLAEWAMNGSTIVSSQAPTSGGNAASPGSSWSIAGFGNFNGAADATDILWRQASTGSLADWSMNGSQIVSSQPITSQGAVVSPDSSWSVVGTGDFNGDGDTDILWRQGSGPISDWSMNGSTISSSTNLTSQGNVLAPDSSWSIAGIGDFNGDGKSDILWRQSSSGSLVEWQMNGSAVASSQTVAAAPDASWTLAGIGDFNGDGKDDMLWRQSSTNTLVEWLMNGSQISSGPAITYQGNVVAPDSSWNVVDIGDFNGDGKSDIMWQQSTTGSLIEWQMNGSQITSTQSVTSQGSPVAPPSSYQLQSKSADFY